ncbi:hypothetical protein ACS0TY_025406 [Phlomoides rotata]
MGFYGPARCGFYRLDHHLITALVERWHPETHTFHFPVGEVTVTLQDVAIIWGLYVEGEPVICAEPQHTKRQWREYCDQMLGFHPQEGEMRTTTSILMSALRERMLHMPAIHDQTPQEDVDKYARGCALLLLGTLMMPDTSRCAVSLLYLHFLEDVTTAHNYSWGSAVLARLYRELCTASQSGAKPIGGAMSLLQFIWVPYDPASPDISGLGDLCVTANWMSQCPLINIDIVEIHHPNRVFRQFRMVQEIPPAVEHTHASLHSVSRKGKTGFNWVEKHASWIEYWTNREPFSPRALHREGPTMAPGYMQ